MEKEIFFLDLRLILGLVEYVRDNGILVDGSKKDPNVNLRLIFHRRLVDLLDLHMQPNMVIYGNFWADSSRKGFCMKTHRSIYSILLFISNKIVKL